MSSLTEHLLRTDTKAFQEATQHPFLRAVATNRLPMERLVTWLAYQRHYQQAKTNFICKMMLKNSEPEGRDRLSSLQWRTTLVLIQSLAKLQDKANLLETTAKTEGWSDDLSGVQSPLQIETYEDLFADATIEYRPFIAGLTVLWATERCYLQAWQYARDHIPIGLPTGEQGVVHKTLISNWTSVEFESFVETIQSLVDEFGRQYKKNDSVWKQCEYAWRQVLQAEVDFWPEVKE